MSPVRRLFRKSFVLTGVFLSVLFIAGCQQVDSGVQSAMATPKGLKPEAFLPQASFMIFEFGAVDKGQQEAFSSLLKHFPAQDQQNFEKSLIQGFDKDLTTYGLDYEKDILPAVGSNLRVMAAFEGTPSKQEKPNVYAFIPLEDPSKMDGIFKKMVQGGFFTQEPYGGTTVFSKSDGDQYMARVDDLLLVTNDSDMLKSAIDRQRGSQPSLITDSVYQKALHQLKPSVGFAYINLHGIFDVIRQDPASRKQFEQLFTQMPGPDDIDAFQGEMFSAQAEQKGLRLYGAVYGDEEKMKTMDQNFLNLPSHEPYLYKKVPGDSVDVYLEGYNLAKVLQYDFKVWEGLQGFAEGFAQVRQAFAQIGLDFDKDFMPLFENGVAFSLHNNGSVLPSFGLFADVQSHADAAEKVMSKLKLIVDILLKDMEPNFKDSPGLFSNDETTVSGGKAYVLRVHPDKINPQDKSLAPLQLFLTKPVELWYGVTGDKLAFLTFEPNFDQNYLKGPRVRDDQSFQRVIAQLQSLGSGISYVSPSTFVSYFDSIFGLAQMGSSGARQGTDDYEKIKSYLKPFTGMVFTTRPVSAGEAHFEGFVLIE